MAGSLGILAPMSRENVDLLRRAYARLAESDPLGDWTPLLQEFMAEDVALWPSAMYLDADEVYRGYDGWARFWREFAAVWNHWRIEVDDIIDAGDDLVVVLARAIGRATASGVDIEQPEGHVWRVRDGRLAAAWTHPDRAEVLRAAGLSGGPPAASRRSSGPPAE